MRVTIHKLVFTWRVNISVIIIAITFSCSNPQSATLQKENETQNQIETVTDEIEGEYYFKYPSGEVEIIIVNPDQTDFKLIYKNEKAFRSNSKTLYENKGSWIINEGKIEFNDWLAYCLSGMNPDSILSEPEDYSYMPATWFPSNEGQKATLDIYSENGYVFTKLD